MREKASYYKQFIVVHPGGGARRNPKRKNAGSFAAPFNAAAPTAAEIERVFEGHLQQMARGGTYGDNMEISAFSSTFGVAVKIYQYDFAYVVSALPQGTEEKVVHIAYHVSSAVRGVPRFLVTSMLINKLDLGALLVHPKLHWPSHWCSQRRIHPCISRI